MEPVDQTINVCLLCGGINICTCSVTVRKKFDRLMYAERKRCAAIASHYAKVWWDMHQIEGDESSFRTSRIAERIAEAIMAQGEIDGRLHTIGQEAIGGLDDSHGSPNDALRRTQIAPLPPLILPPE
jgi:hypothetical protein